VAYVITSACIGVKDEACVATCPADCILGAPDDPMLFIDPTLCIDCAACVPACPVNAIYLEGDVPSHERDFVAVNRDYFYDPKAALQRIEQWRATSSEEQK